MRPNPLNLAAITRALTEVALLSDGRIEFTESRSRQSRSTYLYLSTDDRTVSVRVSDHVNPALKLWRVSGDNDRAEITDFEWRSDLRCGFTERREIATWAELVVAIAAEFHATAPRRVVAAARLAETARATAKTQREAEAEAARAYLASPEYRDKLARQAAQQRLADAIEAEARRLCADTGTRWDGKNRRDVRNRFRAQARAALTQETAR